MDELLAFIHADKNLVDIRHIAYLLATVKHETANTFRPIAERGPRKYFAKYEPGTRIGLNLGNIHKGDGYTFRGRGYPQLTGRANYEKFGRLLGIDLINNPDAALEPDTAYQIISLGMRKGLFTGKKLSDYFNNMITDPLHARRIINGMDRAELIAGYYTGFLKDERVFLKG